MKIFIVLMILFYVTFTESRNPFQFADESKKMVKAETVIPTIIPQQSNLQSAESVQLSSNNDWRVIEVRGNLAIFQHNKNGQIRTVSLVN